MILSTILNNLKYNWEGEHIIQLSKKETLYKLTNKPLFHYTTLANFWNIIDSDHLYARHVRFSNDSEENRIGEAIIRSLFTDEKKIMPKDYYMVCFCETKNLLSQWREYAKGGVCLKFDLSYCEYYTILANKRTADKNKEIEMEDKYFMSKYFVPTAKMNGNRGFSRAYAKPISVFYVNNSDVAIFKNKYRLLKRKYDNDPERPIDKYMTMLIPYIKHIGFREEAEARLLFEVGNDSHTYQVDYLQDSLGVMKPYIRVEFGDAEEKLKDKCTIEYCGLSDEQVNEIKNRLSEFSEITYHPKGGEKEISEIIIGSSKNQIELFEKVDYIVNKWNCRGSNIKVWCLGHLPIREIMVGPCQNREEIVESIGKYTKGVYWLKYVNVLPSDIPYRGQYNM